MREVKFLLRVPRVVKSLLRPISVFLHATFVLPMLLVFMRDLLLDWRCRHSFRMKFCDYFNLFRDHLPPLSYSIFSVLSFYFFSISIYSVSIFQLFVFIYGLKFLLIWRVDHGNQLHLMVLKLKINIQINIIIIVHCID